MRYLSVCSGIEAATVAWHGLGWEPVAFSEVDAFPSAVLSHYYPNTPNLGDMTKFEEWPDATVDILVGGTPCQSFSVAGLRKGLDDPRGNLMLTFGAIAKRYRPEWLVWENVPGVLSSNGGRDFGAFLGMLEQLGYGWSYRTLDAQYFGLAQRRRRVFVVGHLGDWRRAAAVLFERHSLQGHPAPRREPGEGAAKRAKDGPGDRRWPALTAPTLNAAFGDKQGLEDQHALSGAGLFVPDYINSLTAHNGARNEVSDILNECVVSVAHTLRGEGFDASEDGSGRGTPLVPVSVALRGRDGGATAEMGDDLAFSLRASSGGGDKPHVMAHAFDARQSDVIQYGDKTGPLDTDGHSVAVALSDVAQPLRSNGYNNSDPGMEARMHVMQSMQVRRLTPRECERLQGFPDDYTQIPYRNKPADQCPDGPRYKALGNSMAVPVMRWIGERIAAVQAISKERRETA